jgi:hypothetical protein
VKSQILKLSNPFKFNSNHTPKRFKLEKIKTKLFLESSPTSLFYLDPLIFSTKAAALFPSLSCSPKKISCGPTPWPSQPFPFSFLYFSLLP